MSESNSLPTIPFLLTEAVKDQRAVVLLGAGASKECKNALGHTPPDATQLREKLARKYFGSAKAQHDLMTIAEMAIASGAGEPEVFDYIHEMFQGFTPSKAHRALANFKWRALATTNYDLFVEEAYAANRKRTQSCVPFVKDAEPFDDRLRRTTNPLPYLKLHGCLNHRLDTEVPLVLSHEHYAMVSENRVQLLQRLKQWVSESPLILIGYKVSDPHIRKLLYEFESNRRPQWYLISPSADHDDVKFWATKNVELIPATFRQFMDALDNSVPAAYRVLSSPVADENAPYRRHFRTNASESLNLRTSLQTDFEYVHSGVTYQNISPKQFYSGYDSGWCGIVKQYDFSRKTGEELLYKALLSDENRDDLQFFLLQGSAGSGKTIALKRAAYNAATQLDALVLWHRETGTPRIESIQELLDLSGKPIVLFIDSVSRVVQDVTNFVRRARDVKLPLTVVAAEREADWGAYCSQLEDLCPPDIFYLRRLSEREANDLIDLLERHNCLGLLSQLKRDDQVNAFMDRDRADRQLLVALHELTQGKPFEAIIHEEYGRVLPEQARRLYLDIATMHQFGTLARAGSISRINGVAFRDFVEDFLLPLKDIVRVVNDHATRDKSYVTRHARVAQMIFSEVCETDEEKSTQLARIIEGIDIGYSSDRRVLSGVCKGREIARNFAKIEWARLIFDMAHKIAPREAFLYQQHAILEYSHKDGSLDEALTLAETARRLDPRNHIYLHTLAEISRRKANIEESAVRKDNQRASARRLLGQMHIKSSIRDGSYCKILVDETLEMAATISAKPKDHEVITFDKKLEETTKRLERAVNDFPDESDILETEARLWKGLGEDAKAISTLQRAIRARPRSPGVYLRLSRIQAANRDTCSMMETITNGLERFPDNKALHLEMAMALIDEKNEPDDAIEGHFQKSYSGNDHNFDARFAHGEYCYWTGRLEEGQSIFDEIHARSPKTYRTRAPQEDDALTQRLGYFSGTVASRKQRYFFIESGSFSRRIYAFHTSLQDIPLSELEVGRSVTFRVRFNRQGPVASEVKLVTNSS